MEAGCQHRQLHREDGQLTLLALARVTLHTHNVTSLHIIVQQQEAVLVQLRHAADSRQTAGRHRQTAEHLSMLRAANVAVAGCVAAVEHCTAKMCQAAPV